MVRNASIAGYHPLRAVTRDAVYADKHALPFLVMALGARHPFKVLPSTNVWSTDPSADTPTLKCSGDADSRPEDPLRGIPRSTDGGGARRYSKPEARMRHRPTEGAEEPRE